MRLPLKQGGITTCFFFTVTVVISVYLYVEAKTKTHHFVFCVLQITVTSLIAGNNLPCDRFVLLCGCVGDW